MFSESVPANVEQIPALDTDRYRSSPSFGTEKGLFDVELRGFETSNPKLWQQVAVKLPFKLARLVDHSGDMSKRWYVLFYAYDVSRDTLARKRITADLNRIKNIHQRYAAADLIVREVNADLRAGKVLGKDKLSGITQPASQIEKFSLIEALSWFIDQKKANRNKKHYVRKFKTLKNHIIDFLLERHGLNRPGDQVEEFLKRKGVDPPLRSLKQAWVHELFDTFKKKFPANKTFNNTRGDFGTFLNYINKRRPGFFKVNLVEAIDVLPVISKKHAAYSDEQMVQIKSKCIEKRYFQLLFFIQCIYYTLARPQQLLAMKCYHFDLDGNRIFLPGEQDKESRDEYVSISPRFKQIILDKGIDQCDPNLYVFGEDGPAETPIKTLNPFWWRNQEVLKDLGYYQLNPNYSLYSYKHSGAISLYKATKDIKLVQRQCRHLTLEQTNDYLRDLEALTDHDALNGWTGAL